MKLRIIVCSVGCKIVQTSDLWTIKPDMANGVNVDLLSVEEEGKRNGTHLNQHDLEGENNIRKSILHSWFALPGIAQRLVC